MIRRALGAAGAALTCAASLCAPASAYGTGYGITSFSAGSSGSIAFTVTDIVDPALLGSQTYDFTLQGSTGTSRGNVTVTAPTIIGSSGRTIPASDFEATCIAVFDRAGSFS